MNTSMTGFDGFQKSLRPCALDESSLSIDGKVDKEWPGLVLFYCQVFTLNRAY